MLFNFNDRMEMDAPAALSLSVSCSPPLSVPLSNSCALFIMTILFVFLGQGENESGKCGAENRGELRRKRALAQKRRLWAINGNSVQCQ